MGENKKTILLVEDEAISAIVVKQQLEKRGYRVHHVFNGEEAVRTILEGIHPVDLILMDIDLGSGIDGTQAAEQILGHIDIPVVFLSSHTEPEIVEKTEKITSYGYVVKNASIIVLDVSIKMAFRLYEANKKIKESEIKHKSMIANISDVIAIIGADGLIKYESPNIEKFFGWKSEDLADSNGLLHVHPDDSNRFQEQFRGLLERDKSTITAELKYQCKNGSYKPIHLTAINLLNDPIIRGVLLNCHDITEYRQAAEKLQKSEERFRLLFEQAEFSFSLYEAIPDESGKAYDFRYLEVNSAFEKITGRKESDIIGKSLRQVYPETEPYWIDNCMRVVSTGIPIHYENFSKEMNRSIELFIYSPQKGQLAMIGLDTTMRKRTDK